jgi:RsiW-degrading membrane proteinase PrsW (M82 family)
VGAIGRWFKHLVGAMVRGCLVLAAVALVGAVVVVYVTSKALPNPDEWLLIGALAITAGFLGAAVALVWRLSHLDTVAHLMKSQNGNEKPPEHTKGK